MQGFFRIKTGDLQKKKKKGLHRNFKGFYASKIWRNGNPVQHYLIIEVCFSL